MAAALAGCGQGSDDASPAQDESTQRTVVEPRAFDSADEEAITRRPYLRSVLPDTTAAYVRVPSPVGFVAGPGGSGFDRAKRAEPIVDAVKRIQSTADSQRIRERFGPAAWLIELLVQDLNSPLEIAVLRPSDAPATASQALVSLGLEVSSRSEVNALLQRLAGQHPRLRLQQSLATDQDAVVGVSAVQLRLRWRAEDERLIGLGGLGVVSRSDLDEQLEGLSSTASDHPVQAAESEIDTGQRGLFAWVDARDTSRLLQQLPDQRPGVESLRETLREARWVALGWGSAGPVTDGGQRKSRLKFALAAPRDGVRALLPSPTNEFDIQAAGDIDWLLAVALPDAATWRRIDERLRNEYLVNPSARETYGELKTEVSSYLGFPIEKLMAGLGPELVAFKDDAGSFNALRVHDQPIIDGESVGERLFTKALATEHTSHKLASRTYHENRIAWPNWQKWPYDTDDLGDLADVGDAQQGMNVMGGLYSGLLGVPSRFYWLRDQGYVVSSRTPQALMERERYYEPTSISDWLENQQGQDLAHAIAAGSISLDDAPRFIYRQYLLLLNHLADVSGADLDPFAFPTATEVGISEQGTYGFQVINAPDRFAVEMTFDQTPADGLVASPYGMALTGMIAAIAIPQYQEYTERARQTEPGEAPR
jgi:hypothetical protein